MNKKEIIKLHLDKNNTIPIYTPFVSSEAMTNFFIAAQLYKEDKIGRTTYKKFLETGEMSPRMYIYVMQCKYP